MTGRSGKMMGGSSTEQDIVLYHAPRTSTGKDRCDPAILLEVYEWIRDREDCGTVILGSGDADYQVLVDRAKLHGRRIVLCAFSQSVSRDMLAAVPLFPLEAELGIQLAEHGDVTVSLTAVSEVDDPGTDDALKRFRPGDAPAGRPAELRGVQHAVQPVDAGLGDGLERVRVPAVNWTSTRRWGSWNATKWSTPQPGLAHVGGAVDTHQRDGAPGAGIQRRARIKPGPGALTAPGDRYPYGSGAGADAPERPGDKMRARRYIRKARVTTHAYAAGRHPQSGDRNCSLESVLICSKVD